MRSQETRLRRKRSHMPGNLVNFIFSEPGIGGLARTAAGAGGEEKTRQKKKRVKLEKPHQARKRSAGGGDQLPPPWIQICTAMCGRISLCAGVETPARVEPSSDAARSRARGWRGGEQEGGEEHVLPLYRGICACAERLRIRVVPAMRDAHLDKSVLAHPRATLCASAFLQVIVAVSFQRPARDDNGNVETKPVCSSLQQMVTQPPPWAACSNARPLFL